MDLDICGLVKNKNKEISVGKYRILSIIPALCMMIAIFYFSSQNASNSSRLSGGIVTQMFGSIEDIFQVELVKQDNYDKIEKVETLIRKLAHMTEYAILSITLYIPFYVYGKRGRNIIYWSETICVIYAITDEVHQLFVPGRSGQLTDVFIDGIGGLIGCFIISKIFMNLHKQ